MVRKVMFICAHNQTRSVAGEGLLKGEKGFEVRSRAAWRGTTRKVKPSDCAWADEIYVMMPGMKVPVEEACPEAGKKIRALWIPDNYMSCEDELLRQLKDQLKGYGIYVQKSMEKAKSDCWAVTERKMGFGRGEIYWTWEPPSEELLVARRHEEPEGRYTLEEEVGTGSEYPYVPMFHIREGERMARARAEAPMEEKLAEFEEAQRYYQQREDERQALERFGAERTVKDKERTERKMLSELKKYTDSIKKLFE